MRPFRLLPAPAVLLVCLLGASGCQLIPDLRGKSDLGGALTLTGRAVLAKAPTVLESDDHPNLTFHFDRGYYDCEGKQGTTLVLLEGDENNPSTCAIVRVLWRPTAGSTPIDENASNATLRVVQKGTTQTSVWGGAGFMFLKDPPRNAYLTAQCWHADINLIDASADTQDTLGPAKAEGKFTAAYNPEKVAFWLKKIAQDTHTALHPAKP